ncbi:MAG: hypothetical protein HC899_18965, partial [Leptolyngbyaceae cyanobacterium SM1_4_3]|nr:hypothetical protein [Leptolyngbyaceae cyanobacterium SM1_4_3]
SFSHFRRPSFCSNSLAGDRESPNITLLSDYRDLDFARSWGLLIQDLGLLARAVYIVDSTGIVIYQEIVAELTGEPDYGVAFAMLAAEIATLKAAL